MRREVTEDMIWLGDTELSWDKYSLRGLADVADISPGYLSRWKSGEVAMAESKAMRICHLLGDDYDLEN